MTEIVWKGKVERKHEKKEEERLTKAASKDLGFFTLLTAAVRSIDETRLYSRSLIIDDNRKSMCANAFFRSPKNLLCTRSLV